MLRGKTSIIRHAFLLLICNFLKKLRTRSNHFFGTSTYIWDTNHHQFTHQTNYYLRHCSLNHISYVTGQNPWESTRYIGVYVLTCDKDTCQDIYVGQSKNISDRFTQHANAKTCSTYGKSYVSATHSKMRGHDIDPAKGKKPYLSTSLSHRLIIETCLISLCRTVNGNKATSNVRDMDIIAPIVLRASLVDWKALSEAQPSRNIDIVPRK